MFPCDEQWAAAGGCDLLPVGLWPSPAVGRERTTAAVPATGSVASPPTFPLGMTVLRAGEARRSDAEAMSTGSELSEEGSDVVFFCPTSTSPPKSTMGRSSRHPCSAQDSACAYEASVAHILQLHRALAHSYSSSLDQPAANPRGRVHAFRAARSMSADFTDLVKLASAHQQHHPNQHNNALQTGLAAVDTEPTSPTPSEGSSGGAASTGGSTPRGKNSKFNLATISENLGLLMRSSRNSPACDEVKGHRIRSNSASVSPQIATLADSDVDEDSDDDDDDYGFLSHYSGLFSSPSSTCNNNNNDASAAGMHKSKSPATPRRLLPKRWRKPKWTPSKESPVPWTPEGSCTWSDGSGKRVTLTPTSLINLSKVERIALQKIGLAKLHAMDLGCAITIPKDGSSHKRSKRSAFSLKRKTISDLSSGWVFGIPLAKVNANDIELRRRKPSSLKERRESVELSQRHTRKSSSSSVSRSSQHSCQQSLVSLSVSSSLEVLRSFSYPAGAASSDSLSETDGRSTGSAATNPGPAQGSNLIEALSLSSSAKLESSWRDQRESLSPHSPVVPYIVKACCQHLETYGLRVIGIFRIGSSKKRIKQLREEFDCGRDVKLNENHNPHDVGALLKEFFRDLPDPLLTRDLYDAFLATRKITDFCQRLTAMSLLLALLPATNRDTVWGLLVFLDLVVQHSVDTVDDHGNKVPGNKMDSHNLATLFGPNIMHKAKGGEFEVTTAERAEERHDIIAVVKEMIDYHKRLFEVPAETHDEIIRYLMEMKTESADYLLRRKAALSRPETDTETTSSFYDENEQLPRSASYCSETEDSSRQRTHGDKSSSSSKCNGSGSGVGAPQSGGGSSSSSSSSGSSGKGSLEHRPGAGEGRRSLSSSRMRSAEPPPPLEMLKIPQFRISSPDQGWYRPDSRSPSPLSPRISPSPKAMKSATPDLRGRSAADQPRERASSTNALILPRPVRFRRQLTLGPPSAHLSVTALPSSPTSPHMLTVPQTHMGLKRDRDSDSSSSLSSYYPSTSRSTTNSPITPDAPYSWNLDTPPASPRSPSGAAPGDAASALEARTSSRQRPLGVNVRVGSRQTTGEEGPQAKGPHDWQRQRWKQWEMLTKEHSDEFQEQETLV